jgi:ATP phosphoribosyltransferase
MSKLKIAIQKSGRLHKESLQLLKDCGLSINNGKDQLKVEVDNFSVDLLYLRNSDIPQYIEDGTAHVGIVGQNLLVEKQKKVSVVKKLGFSKCRVSLAVPKEVDYPSVQYFQGKKIATSYPNTLKSYLSQQGVEAEVHTISGSVQIAPNIGLAHGICDIVSSGSTLFKNGLKETEVLLQSQAVLIKSVGLTADMEAILNQLLFRINAVLRAKNNKYILLNVPNTKIEAVTQILPVLKSPTILPLAQEGWSSLHSVIQESQFWQVIDQLKDAGAEDILIVPINKMVV